MAGSYAASLTVNDGKVNSGNIATVTVTASTANGAPDGLELTHIDGLLIVLL
jgi:uncharacterized protein YjdB